MVAILLCGICLFLKRWLCSLSHTEREKIASDTNCYMCDDNWNRICMCISIGVSSQQFQVQHISFHASVRQEENKRDKNHNMHACMHMREVIPFG